MGGSSVLCNNVPIAVDTIQLSLSCPSGQLNFDAYGQESNTKVFDFGIISDKETEKDYCQVS